MPKKQRDRAFWNSLVKEFEVSGKTRGSFANAHQIKPSTFHYWLYKIRRDNETNESPPFLEVAVAEEPSFVSRVRLDFPSGATLSFDKALSTDELHTIITALKC